MNLYHEVSSKQTLLENLQTFVKIDGDHYMSMCVSLFKTLTWMFLDVVTILRENILPTFMTSYITTLLNFCPSSEEAMTKKLTGFPPHIYGYWGIDIYNDSCRIPKQNIEVVYSAMGTLGGLDVTPGYRIQEVVGEVMALVDHTEEGHGENYGGERWVRPNPIHPVRFARGSLRTAQKSPANKTSLPQGETS